MSVLLLSTVTTKAIASAGSSNWNGGHTTGSTTNYLLLKLFQTATIGSAPTTVNWNGVAMTPLGSKVQGTSAKMFMYGMANPAIGTLTFTVSWGVSARGGWIAENYSGVDASGTPTGTFVSAGGTSTAPSVVATSNTGELVTDALCHHNADTYTITAVGGGQTETTPNFVGSAGAGANSARCAASTEAGAASVTMSYTLSNAAAIWAIGAIPLLPAPAGSGTGHRLGRGIGRGILRGR